MSVRRFSRVLTFFGGKARATPIPSKGGLIAGVRRAVCTARPVYVVVLLVLGISHNIRYAPQGRESEARCPVVLNNKVSFLSVKTLIVQTLRQGPTLGRLKPCLRATKTSARSLCLGGTARSRAPFLKGKFPHPTSDGNSTTLGFMVGIRACLDKQSRQREVRVLTFEITPKRVRRPF